MIPGGDKCTGKRWKQKKEKKESIKDVFQLLTTKVTGVPSLVI